MAWTLFIRMFSGAAVIALSATAHAQSPTKAQQDAIRANCRSDFMANCSGVARGGAEALMCLEQNKAKLSGGCRSAIDAVAAAAAPKPAPAPVEAKPAPTPAATAPVEKPTTTEKPAPTTSKPAAKSVPAPKAAAVPVRPAAPPPAAPTAPAAVSPPAAAPDAPKRQPTLGEAVLIRRFCFTDYRVLCKGTQIGGGRALGCLSANRPSLSPGCRAALADTGN